MRISQPGLYYEIQPGMNEDQAIYEMVRMAKIYFRDHDIERGVIVHLNHYCRAKNDGDIDKMKEATS